MSVVKYNCDTCHREVSRRRNLEGLEVSGKCVITKGCRGSLHQVEILQDYIRGEPTPEVSGLTDWTPRKAVHDHTQTVKKAVWDITHEMGIVPTVSVFTVDQLGQTVEDTPEDTITVDGNTTRLVFPYPKSGFAQLITTNTKPTVIEEDTTVVVNDVQATNNGELTIATISDAAQLIITLGFVLNDTTDRTFEYAVDDVPSVNSPWSDYNKILLDGRVYTVRSFNVNVAALSPVLLDNATMTFTIVDGIPIETFGEDAVILLGSAPFDPVDKNVSQYTPVPINPVDLETNPYYDSGEIIIRQETLVSVYPRILKI